MSWLPDGRIAADMDYPPDWMLRGVLPSFATVPPRLYPALALCAALGLPRLNSLGPAAWRNHARSPHVVLAPRRSSYFAKYVAAYASRGVPIDFLEAFNEPTDSYTRMSPQKLAAFLGEHLGPTFDRLGLRPRTRLTYGGQAERWRAREVVPRLMADPKARRYMDVIACACRPEARTPEQHAQASPHPTCCTHACGLPCSPRGPT